MNRELNLGIIGCGWIAEGHITDWKAINGAKVVAVSDISEERAKKTAKLAGDVEWYSDYRDLLKRDDVTCVDICTPPFLHAENIIAAAKAGKHIMCEKPLTVNLDDADRALAAVTKAHLKMMVAFQRVFWPEYLKIKEIIDRKELGDPVRIYTKAFHMAKWLEKAWFWDPKKSGGLTVESLIHFSYYFPWFFGPVERVYGEAGTFYYPGRKPTIPDDQAAIMMRFKNKAIGIIEAAASCPSNYPPLGYLELNFTDGMIDRDELTGHLRIYKGTKEYSPEVLEIVPPAFPENTSSFGHCYLLKHFAECILEDKTPVAATAEDGRQALHVSWSAIKSYQTAMPVKVPLQKPYPSY